ncbi:SGS-domain-containing protein [Annulohypoxylon maeteangense]|uniref:SGS-domain-containing protein n=1 Tax=Annulohypoxylon maeteangense TaxID=1927788 RepID=UPI00200801E1|nr:SGS-domain-containing protein [Annulohypoxylon maeteangense]KAI0883113.1 SGS-domain-containing protein [Annulohypoxylon maeteangense]
MPSAANLAAEGVKAVANGKYQEGIDNLTEALKDHAAPLWLLERSKAYVRTNEIDLALRDADKALEVSFQRANRDHMIEAQIRRAVTLFRLERYADADICAFWAMRLVDGAKVSEDDQQQKKVDEIGDYTVSVDEIKSANKPAQGQGFSTAMGGATGRAREITQRNQALSWRLQALTHMEKLPAGHPGRKVNPMEKFPKVSGPDHSNTDSDIESDEVAENGSDDDWDMFYTRYIGGRRRNAIRTNFYQTNTTVNVDFFVKNISADRFTVTAENQKVIMGPFPDTYPESVHLNLWGRIKPDEITHNVKSMKVELVLRKETAGKWPMLQLEDAEGFDNLSGSTGVDPSLENFTAFIRRLGYKSPKELDFDDYREINDTWYGSVIEKIQAGLDDLKVSAAKGSEVPSGPTEAATTAQPKGDLKQASSPAAQPTPTVSKADSAKSTSAQAYPTSSKKVVNWDKLADVDDEDEEDKDADVNSFFQKLYKDSDPDSRRAMMKSYVESNGTSLSTNWSEAQSKTYKTQPPDGAEAKKWD